MTQKELDNIQGFILESISHYQSGIMTTLEFKQSIERIGVIGSVSGLTDNATGLKYP